MDYTLNTESTYDWEASQWSVPINAVVSKVVALPYRRAGSRLAVAGP